MSEEDLKSVISMYQQKCFELFNSNIIFETQIKSLQNKISVLENELEKYKSSKTRKKVEEDFQ
jgi:hypothetical protein